MYVQICSEITVGGKRFGGVNEVKITRSIHDLIATATIKVPVTAVLRQKEVKTYVETAKAIRSGDEVLIRLGYNNSFQTEFKGYVKLLNLKTPLEIVCEDAFYLTRSRSVTLSGTHTLQGILSKCGLVVGHCAALTIKNFAVDNKPVSWVLAKLKSDYGLSVFFDTEGRIYASEPYKVIGDRVKYRFRYNTKKDDDLKYHRADDVRLKIKAVCIYRDGTKVEAIIGAKDGTEKILYFYDVANKQELADLAAAELKRHSYDGYSGKIETFLQPFAAPGMVAEISDPVYAERNGNYYIESVETTFGMSGAHREVGIGLRI